MAGTSVIITEPMCILCLSRTRAASITSCGMRRRNTIRRDTGAVTSKLHFECMKDYIYVYRLRCTKQDVVRTQVKVMITFATDAKRSSMTCGISDSFRAVCGYVHSRALTTSKLLPKVAICINIILHTQMSSADCKGVLIL